MGDFGGRIDQLLRARFRNDEPGVVTLVKYRREVVLCSAYGMANLEHSIPLAVDSVLRVGSLTKQFTAMGIGILVASGKVALDAPVNAYLTDFTTLGGRVPTVHQLLTHTSGVPERGPMRAQFWQNMRDVKVTDLVNATREREPVFLPGEDFACA